MHSYHVASPYREDSADVQVYLRKPDYARGPCNFLCDDLEVPIPQGDTIGKRIAQARRELGVREVRDIPTAELARLMRVPASTVMRWEADLSTPSGANLVKLARVLGVSAEWIQEGRGPDAKTAPQTGAPHIHVDEMDTVPTSPPKPAKKKPASG